FADLAAQAEALDDRDRALEARERARIEVGSLTMMDRLRATVGSSLHVRCVSGLTVHGLVVRTGSDWLLLRGTHADEVLVRAEAVSSVIGTSAVAAPSDRLV